LNQSFHLRFWNPLKCLSYLRGIPLEEIEGQERNILPSLLKRRNINGKYVQAIV